MRLKEDAAGAEAWRGAAQGWIAGSEPLGRGSELAGVVSGRAECPQKQWGVVACAKWKWLQQEEGVRAGSCQETHFFPSCPQGLPGGQGGGERGREGTASAFRGWFSSWPLLVWLDRPGSGAGWVREGPSSGSAKDGTFLWPVRDVGHAPWGLGDQRRGQRGRGPG